MQPSSTCTKVPGKSQGIGKELATIIAFWGPKYLLETIKGNMQQWNSIPDT